MNSQNTIPMFRKICLPFLLMVLCSIPARAQDLSLKANTFLNSLSDELRAETHFSLSDDERFNMNFVPIDRKGPSFHDFNAKQRQAALDLLKASLSSQGYVKTTEIMSLEKVLYELGDPEQKMSDGRPYRDPLNYHLCIFGAPAPENFWGWRFEGHHISLNFTASEGKLVSSTPTFFGSNPGIVRSTSQKGKEVLKKETDLGFALISSMSEEQLKITRFSDAAPREIITGNKRKVETIEPLGISYSDLSENQKRVFEQLVNLYIDNYESEFASGLKQKLIAEGMEKLHFAWAGSLMAGQGHYYRIQGDFLIIEYDNVQNNANHVHTAVRDLTNDYGEDLLKSHYKKHHK